MRNLIFISIGVLAAAWLAPHEASGQRIQFSAPASPNGVAYQPAPAATVPPSLTPNPNNLAPIRQPVTGSAGAAIQPPSFDPFSSQPGAATTPPSLIAPPTQPQYAQPPYYNGQPAPGSAAPYYQPLYSSPAEAYPGYPGYPAQPSSQFPGGLFGPNGCLGNPAPGPYLRLFQDLRFRYTWLKGNGGTDVDINVVDVAVTMNWPNFLYSGEPLRISPGFAFNFWNGPSPPAPPFAELPGQAYDAYLDAFWTTNQQARIGGDINVRAGVYTDFNTITTDSFRITGTGLGWFRITDTLTLKGGVTYLDRVDIKILPAGGLFWRPNPDVNFELYFPRPKLAQRLTTLGNTDIWWYLGAEYGGGSWTFQRTTGTMMSDQVDINDIRVYGGVEWFSGIVAIKGFVEAGYVFERELVYRSGPTLKLDDTYMLRGGLSY